MLIELSIENFVLCVCINTMACKKGYYMHKTTTRLLLENVFYKHSFSLITSCKQST